MILGLTYIPNYIDESQEKELLSSINKFEWDHSLKEKLNIMDTNMIILLGILIQKDNLGEYPEWFI